MENSTGGSFIPKRSTGKVAPSRSSKRIYIFSYIAYALFFGTLLSVAGIFLLNYQANAQLAGYAIELQDRKAQFSDSQMDDVMRLSRKLGTAEALIERHLAPSRLFEQLETSILTSVQIGSFDYTNSGSGDVEVSFSGNTDSFDALVFQRDVMQSSALLASATVVDVVYGSETIEAVGNSSRNQIDPLVTEAKLTFTFSDDAVYDKLGYQPRSGSATTPTVSVSDSADTASSTNEN